MITLEQKNIYLPEISTVRFLRQLINFDAGMLPDGKLDPGWCCTEHAVIASLMFVILGVKVSLCQGKLLIGPDSNRRVFDVEPHHFVITEEPVCLFDSSVTYQGFEGIPCRFSGMYQGLGVGLVTGTPSDDDFTREYKECGKEVLALYAPRLRKPPSEHTVRWTSSTPFGSWLMDLLGSQSGIWGKAAFCAAEVYSGRIPFPHIGLERASMWRQVAASPDKDKFILTRIHRK